MSAGIFGHVSGDRTRDRRSVIFLSLYAEITQSLLGSVRFIASPRSSSSCAVATRTSRTRSSILIEHRKTATTSWKCRRRCSEKHSSTGILSVPGRPSLFQFLRTSHFSAPTLFLRLIFHEECAGHVRNIHARKNMWMDVVVNNAHFLIEIIQKKSPCGLSGFIDERLFLHLS